MSRISGIRKQKEYLPRDVEGKTQYISSLSQLDLKKDKWLILTRTKSNLLEIMKELKKRNLYFETNKGKSFKVRLYKAAVNYTKWTIEEKLEPKEIEDLNDFIEREEWDKNKEWYRVFSKAPEKEVTYIRGMLENDEALNEPARIWLSTIHAIKGGEENNVVLSLHQGDKIQKAIKRSKDKADEEHRVWYVAITRARNNLYKLKSKIKRKEYTL